MRESRPTVSLESLLYVALLSVGAWLRFNQLDLQPLTDAEASEALAALPSPSQFQPTDQGRGTPAFVVLTGLVFNLAGAEDSTARWISALAGTALLFSPFLVRKQIGRGPALMATLLLAISPTLWASSRMAGGTAIAAVGLLAGMLSLARSEAKGGLEWAAGALGLVAVSGRAGLVGLGTVAVGSGALLYYHRRRSNPHPDPNAVLPWPSSLPAVQLRRLLVLAALVGLGLASGMGFALRGVGGIADGLGAWAGGFFAGSGVAAATVLLQLPAYEPILLVFGGMGLLRAIRQGTPLDRWLGAWTIGAVVWIGLYPGRQPADVVWLVIPLTYLAARAAADTIERALDTKPAWLLIGFAGAVLVLLSFSYTQLAALVRSPNALQSFLGLPVLLMLALMGMGLALGVVVLLGLGWSRKLASSVAGTAGLAVLLALGLSAGGRLNLVEASAKELWRAQASTEGLRGLIESLDTLSEATAGRPAAIPIQLTDPSTPALGWALRAYASDNGSDPTARPPVVLMQEASAAGGLPGDYLGQSVVIGERWGWAGWWPPDLFAWWMTRKAPTNPDRWVLLVRPDVAGVAPPAPVEEP